MYVSANFDLGYSEPVGLIVRPGGSMRLGAGNATVSAVASTVEKVAVAIPIVGAIAGLVAFLAGFIGGGCGQTCVDASKRQQVYEAAADNLYKVAKAGMITPSEAIAGMQAFIQSGEQQEAQLGTSSGQKGSANLANVIGQEIAATQGLSVAPQTLDLTAAQALFVGGSGWYPDAIAAASTITMQYLQQLVASPARVASSAASSVSNAVSSAVQSATAVLGTSAPYVLIGGAGILLWAIFRKP